MPDLTPFVGPVGGPLVGACIALFGVFVNARLTQQHQLHQDALKDARALRDAQHASLSKTYESALLAMVHMEHFIAVLRSKPVGWGVELLNDNLEALFSEIDVARAKLLLDVQAEAVSYAFVDLFQSFTALRLALNARLKDPQARHAEIDKPKQEFQLRLAAVRLAVHRSLTPLANHWC